MLDLKRLQMIREIARRGSFAAAADALNFSPSAVSQQMTALERQSETTLFERGPRGVTLTEAGRALARHADVVLDRILEAEADLRGIAGLAGGTLGFGSFSSATTAFAARAVETFRARYPAVAVHFADGEPHESVSRLKAREIDLAVVFRFDRWASSVTYDGERVAGELQSIPLFDDPYLLVVPRGHRLAEYEAIAAEQLAGERILGGSPWAADFEHTCRLAGVEPDLDLSHRATGFEAFQAFVAAGRGLTLMPRLALGWLRDDVVARRLEPATVRHVELAMLADAPASAAILAMADIVQELGTPSLALVASQEEASAA